METFEKWLEGRIKIGCVINNMTDFHLHQDQYADLCRQEEKEGAGRK